MIDDLVRLVKLEIIKVDDIKDITIREQVKDKLASQ